MDTGALVPDEVVIGLVGERLASPTRRAGAVLDGFPRTAAQAEALDRLLRSQEAEIDRVVFFEVARAELLRRLTGRRSAGAAARATTSCSRRPARRTSAIGAAERCISATDDAEAAVEKRLDVYASQTAPLLDYYRGRGALAEVRGEGAVADVTRGHPPSSSATR